MKTLNNLLIFTAAVLAVCVGAANSHCLSGQWECYSGGCIEHSSVCDKLEDCSDGSDETACCELRCPDNSGCIHKDWLCDGLADCSNGWDESDCANSKSHSRSKRSYYGDYSYLGTTIGLPIGMSAFMVLMWGIIILCKVKQQRIGAPRQKALMDAARADPMAFTRQLALAGNGGGSLTVNMPPGMQPASGFAPPIAGYGGPQTNYGGPQANFGGQQASYGGPQASHGGQQAGYGGPQTSYGGQ